MLAVPWCELHIPKELACEFLGAFSRFEYALKVAGYARQRSGYAEPDWQRFSLNISGKFDARASKELGGAVEYLHTNPPMRQTFDSSIGLAWRALRIPQNASQAQALIGYVRCVRNNLFHGGKFLKPPVGSLDRDHQLVCCSLTVLEAFVSLDNDVRDAFFM